MSVIPFGHRSDTKSPQVGPPRPKITDHEVKKLRPPARIVYDSQIPGFGARVTPAGVVSFVLNYSIHGRERRYTIGRYPEISALEAREEALRLRAGLRNGHDPLAERARARAVPTVAEFAQEYLARHAEPEKRPVSVRDDKRHLKAVILPRLGRFGLDTVTRQDIEALRRDLAATPVEANRVLALLHTMFNLAIRWERVPAGFANPARGVNKYHEEERKRWAQEAELARLLKSLDQQKERDQVSALKLILLTGSRKGETLSATWDQFDLERGTWTKPSHATKEKKTETVPLSPPALELLAAMARSRTSDYLFPGKGPEHRRDLRKLWKKVRENAKLQDLRMHDLRHTFASHLVSRGAPLALVGKLVGHTQARTTQRYAHLADEALREVSNQFGKVYESAERRSPR